MQNNKDGGMFCAVVWFLSNHWKCLRSHWMCRCQGSTLICTMNSIKTFCACFFARSFIPCFLSFHGRLHTFWLILIFPLSLCYFCLNCIFFNFLWSLFYSVLSFFDNLIYFFYWDYFFSKFSLKNKIYFLISETLLLLSLSFS